MFREIKKRLLTVYDESEAHSLALIVMEDIGKVTIGKDLIENHPLTEPVKKAVERLLDGEPIQYVLGWCCFCGISIKCDRRALIPRPETEWMVQRLINEKSINNVNRILDLGTGTGCIAIALAHAFPESEVTGIDISEQALVLAHENAQNAGLTNINFMKGDMTSLNLDGSFDIIISNPPYITSTEKQEMRKNVLDWEPHDALFVPDDDKLLFHRSIIEYSRTHLAANGVLVIEINEQLADITRQLTTGSKIINDQFGKPRFMIKYGQGS